MVCKRIYNNSSDLALLGRFVEEAGESLLTFRYFSSRQLNVIKDHLVTLLILEGEKPVAYGHLDPDKDLVWLGICVSAEYAGKGYGGAVMKYLTDTAKEEKVPEIILKVDAINSKAIQLYRKFGFEDIEVKEGEYHIMKCLTSK